MNSLSSMNLVWFTLQNHRCELNWQLYVDTETNIGERWDIVKWNLERKISRPNIIMSVFFYYGGLDSGLKLW